MMVVRGGTSVVIAGLDYWFDESDDRLDPDEFQVEEWRLANLLQVNRLLLPPDYRRAWFGKDVPNSGLTIPVLRFPQWHVCNRCGFLDELPLDRTETPGCLECSGRGFKSQMRQVRFVAMCDHGHLQDFPWREWVHRSADVRCTGKLRLKVAPGAALAAQIVVCECGRKRNLQGITTAGGGTSYITGNLLDGQENYFCRGRRPWLGSNSDGTCTRPLQGSLRSASNLHFPVIKRSIFIPQVRGEAEEALELLNETDIASTVYLMNELNAETSKIADTLFRKFKKQLGRLKRDTVLLALEGML
ncbi:MAG: hypothetical protein KC800_34380, partial [Candidatus Eremiobacteraeota bacterium]|nr:hypothetical protein [Candidatus Eremiobacteraeota bacterium]